MDGCSVGNEREEDENVTGLYALDNRFKVAVVVPVRGLTLTTCWKDKAILLLDDQERFTGRTVLSWYPIVRAWHERKRHESL